MSQTIQVTNAAAATTTTTTANGPTVPTSRPEVAMSTDSSHKSKTDNNEASDTSHQSSSTTHKIDGMTAEHINNTIPSQATAPSLIASASKLPSPSPSHVGSCHAESHHGEHTKQNTAGSHPATSRLGSGQPPRSGLDQNQFVVSDCSSGSQSRDAAQQDDAKIHATITACDISAPKSNHHQHQHQHQEVPTTAEAMTGTKRPLNSAFPESIMKRQMKSTECILFAAALLEAKDTTDCSDPKLEQLTKSYIDGIGTSHDGDAGASQRSMAKKQKFLTMNGKVGEQGAAGPGFVSVAETVASGCISDAAGSEEDSQGAEEDETGLITTPKSKDVLCGRGGSINRHQGNIIYRKVVDHNKPFYQKVQKKYRILVSQSIVQSIINHGGRFLISHGRQWETIDFKKAVQKTSQALREKNTGTSIQDVVA
mmetsp:Transcript_17222/g.48445  ORF Transcript_17222/g.48445 Transcript_17222/m.48445 type:complete len:425 (+) Transcript_17222:199-1473(+)